MFHKVTIAIAAGAIALTTHAVNAGPSNGPAALKDLATADSPIIRVHKKRCKFHHPDGYTYKDHCPHEYKKGSRKKRAGIGALVGGATGAIIGGAVGGGRGAAIGAGAGVAAGALGGAASVRKCWYRDSKGRKVKVKCKQ